MATTLNIYAHITDDMRVKTTVDFDHGIAKREQIMPPVRKLALENMTTFTAVKQGPVASVSSVNTAEEANIPQEDRTAKSAVATSTPIPARNAKKS